MSNCQILENMQQKTKEDQLTLTFINRLTVSSTVLGNALTALVGNISTSRFQSTHYLIIHNIRSTLLMYTFTLSLHHSICLASSQPQPTVFSKKQKQNHIGFFPALESCSSFLLSLSFEHQKHVQHFHFCFLSCIGNLSCFFTFFLALETCSAFSLSLSFQH